MYGCEKSFTMQKRPVELSGNPAQAALAKLYTLGPTVSSQREVRLFLIFRNVHMG